MADYSKKPSGSREPLLFRLHASAWGPDPYSPAGGGGNGNFTCRLPTGTSALVNAYDRKPGPLSTREPGGFDGWWEDWWGEIEKSWDKTSADVADWFERAGQVELAFEMAFTGKYVAEAIEREAGALAAALPGALIMGLKHMAEVLVTTTVVGGVVGGVLTIEAGGAGVIPGGVLGFELGMLYLEVTGLAEVAGYIVENIGEVTSRVSAGVDRAWNAGRQGRPKADDIRAAAETMAGAVGVLFRLTLEAVAAFILRKGLGKTVEALGKSKFGPGFADWVGKHNKELTGKFKPKQKGKGAGDAGDAGGGGSKGAAEAPKTQKAKTAGETKQQKAETLKQNRKNGKLREEQVKQELEAEGHEVLGSQVTVKTSKTTRVIDHLIRDGKTGEIRAVEVKSGNAVRSPTQLAKDAAMESEGAVVIGKNAPAELLGETLKIKTEVRK